MKTRVTEICGTEFPIVLGPMMYISTASLVISVSEAGGLGCLAGAGMSEKEFRKQVESIRGATNFPFAVNIAWAADNSQDLMQWSLADEIDIIISSAGCPDLSLGKIKAAGVKVLQVVANVAQALKAQALGLDGVITKGYESGGMNSFEAVGSMALIPMVVDAVTLPVIAAGGIADGRGVAAALALGAEGVLIGTRFLVSDECLIPDDYKKALIESADTDTCTVRFSDFSVRVLKNRRALSLGGDERPWELVSNFNQLPDASENLMGAGQIAGLIKNCSPVTDIFQEIIAGFAVCADKLRNFS